MILKTTRLISAFLLFPFMLIASGCGGGGGGSQSTLVPTDTSLEFALFPNSYFEGNYSTSYMLSGVSSDGESMYATLNEKSGDTITFSSFPAITIDSQFSVNNSSTGAITSNLSETYYSTNLDNLTLMGSYRVTDGILSMPTSTTVIPLTARIGDFGKIGTYILSDGTETRMNWRLEGDYNGKAKLLFTTTHLDTNGQLYSTTTFASIIEQDGTRSTLGINITYHQGDSYTISLLGYQQ